MLIGMVLRRVGPKIVKLKLNKICWNLSEKFRGEMKSVRFYNQPRPHGTNRRTIVIRRQGDSRDSDPADPTTPHDYTSNEIRHAWPKERTMDAAPAKT